MSFFFLSPFPKGVVFVLQSQGVEGLDALIGDIPPIALPVAPPPPEILQLALGQLAEVSSGSQVPLS